MPTSFEMDSYPRQYIYAPFAEPIKLSDLSELLWNSLKSGAREVDVIHHEAFVKDQIEYFKEEFSSAEIIVSNLDELARNFHFYEPPDPMKSFVKLGKLAQLKIVQEGMLEFAVSNYEHARQIVEKRE